MHKSLGEASVSEKFAPNWLVLVLWWSYTDPFPGHKSQTEAEQHWCICPDWCLLTFLSCSLSTKSGSTSPAALALPDMLALTRPCWQSLLQCHKHKERAVANVNGPGSTPKMLHCRGLAAKTVLSGWSCLYANWRSRKSGLVWHLTVITGDGKLKLHTHSLCMLLTSDQSSFLFHKESGFPSSCSTRMVIIKTQQATAIWRTSRSSFWGRLSYHRARPGADVKWAEIRYSQLLELDSTKMCKKDPIIQTWLHLSTTQGMAHP